MSEPTIDPKLAKADAKAATARAKALRPWFKKKRFIVPIAIVLIAGISTAANGGNGKVASNTSTTESTETKEETPKETVAQQNAREKAQNYLDTMPFSRTGLVKQLVFEEFEKADAEYGVDALKVDWNEQAAKKAQSYLDVMSFSQKSLIAQLKFDGFTLEQAKYGVKKVGL